MNKLKCNNNKIFKVENDNIGNLHTLKIGKREFCILNFNDENLVKFRDIYYIFDADENENEDEIQYKNTEHHFAGRISDKNKKICDLNLFLNLDGLMEILILLKCRNAINSTADLRKFLKIKFSILNSVYNVKINN